MSVVDDAVLNYSEITSIRYCSSTRIDYIPKRFRSRRAISHPLSFASGFARSACASAGGSPVYVSMRWCSGYHIAEASISASLQNQPKLPVRTSLVPSCAQTVASTAVSK